MNEIPTQEEIDAEMERQKRIKWITSDRALEISGHNSKNSLGIYIRTWNKANPDAKIYRVKRRIDETTLREALYLTLSE